MEFPGQATPEQVRKYGMIVRPITLDGRVGFDSHGQLLAYKVERQHMVHEHIADVRGCLCQICGHGWLPNGDSMLDQYRWRLIDDYVHESCLLRHSAFVERAEFDLAIAAARLRFERLVPIENRYWPKSISESKKPWYQVKLLDHPVEIVIGARKKVDSVSFLPVGDHRFDWWDRAERAFATEDVTKEFGPERILVHAWTNEKMRDYMKRIAQAGKLQYVYRYISDSDREDDGA